jgi:tRNA pseudouridine55 synthase
VTSTPAKGPAAEGVVVVDKPRGPTSHDVVARARRALRTREIGHAGTLDPMATGVLVLAVGEATKLVTWLTAHDKSYLATIRLGVATGSFDADGAETGRVSVGEAVVAALSRDDRTFFEAALSAERARDAQIPPAVSAIKIDGVAAHARVRAGEVLDLPPRPVAVRTLAITAMRADPPEIDLAITCAKGYYVRSLARDLSARLGTVGHLVALRRTRSGPFDVGEAVDLESIGGAAPIPLAAAATRALSSVELTPEGALRARQGKRLSESDFATPPQEGPTAWLDRGVLVAVGAFAAGEGRVVRGFRPR